MHGLKRIATTLTRWFPVLGALTMAACDDGPKTVAYARLDDPWSFAQRAVARGMLVEVRGDPFPGKAERLSAVVLATMRSTLTRTATVHLTTDPTAAADPNTRILMIFNAAGDSDAACRGAVPGGGPNPDGSLRLAAVFCAGQDLVSRVNGRIGAAGNVDDPRVARLVAAVMIDLFPDPRRP